MSVTSPLVSSWSRLLLIGFRMKKCLPSFEVLNCWFNSVASCLDDDNEVSFKVIASFYALRFALPSIPFIVLHSLVRSVFWAMVSTKYLNFSRLCTLFCGGHHVQYICWYRLLVDFVASSRDMVRCCFE